MAKKLPYGPVNVEMFQQIKEKILAEPRLFDMDNWGMRLNSKENYLEMSWIEPEDRPPCNTIACIAGWVLAIDHLKTHKTLKTCVFFAPNKAAEILGIDRDVVGDEPSIEDKVFIVSDWPDKFRRLYDKASSKKERAEVAAKYIDWICGVKK